VRRRRRKTFADQKLEETLELGLGLAEPECRYFGDCGGCVWQSMAYERQLEFKREWVQQAFADAGLSDVDVPLPLPSPELYGYRNKMEFSFASRRWLTRREIDSGEVLDRDFALGLHCRGAFDRVIDIASCPLQSAEANAYLEATRNFARESGLEPYDLRRQTGFYRYLTIRHGVMTQQTVVVLVTTERRPDVMKAFTEYLHAHDLDPACVANGVTDSKASTSEGSEYFVDYGPPEFEERLRGWSFTLGVDAFFQPNTRGAERLCEVIERYAALEGHETVLDLYCGVGVLAIMLAPRARWVLGVEKAASAAQYATRNAASNGLTNAQFFAADLDTGIPPFPEHFRPDVVVTDPPRAGMHKKTLGALRDLAPERIVSVSCHPVPQAENIVALCEGGAYFVAEAQPVDMFPHTAHVENVVLLKRGE